MRTMIIGVGYHARRIYLPFLFNNRCSDLICGIDVTSQKNVIEDYLSSHKYNLKMYYTDDLTQDCISDDLKEMLSRTVKLHRIDSVIISTEPLMHFKYARWALENNLNILMDKPITTESQVSTDLNKARKIISDYDYLAGLYRSRKKAGLVQAFSLMSQRRFHPAYELMKKKVEEVYERTKCPITSVQISHSDGQWRFPTEIIEQDYHPYNQGYGKISHSGYHSIDILNWLVEATSKGNKEIDSIDVYSNFVRPSDIISQLDLNDYKNLFPDFDIYNKYTQNEFEEISKGYGEIDAFCSIAFNKGSKKICLASINAIHNGFSQRNWVTAAGKDLYKGNGRIRQESYFIEQGPFQSIAFISYQSEEINPKNNDGLYDFGGEKHLDIHVFRNSKMFHDWKSHEMFSIKDLDKTKMTGYSRGHQEDARAACIIDFFEAIKEKRNTKSDLLDHKKGTYLLSAIYQSEILKTANKNPIVNICYKNKAWKERPCKAPNKEKIAVGAC